MSETCYVLALFDYFAYKFVFCFVSIYFALGVPGNSSEEDYDLIESYAWELNKRKFLLNRILENYEMPKLSITLKLPAISNAK